MTTALADACSDFAGLLPVASALISQPDTDGHHGHAAPGSSPPWNPAAAAAVFDALEGIRRIHAAVRYSVTGRDGPLRPHAVTGGTLLAIVALAEALPAEEQREVGWQLARHLHPILWLAAIDAEEQPRRNLQCPRCLRSMLRYWARSGEVACLGCMQKGQLFVGVVSGQPILRWVDGMVHAAPVNMEGTA